MPMEYIDIAATAATHARIEGYISRGEYGEQCPCGDPDCAANQYNGCYREPELPPEPEPLPERARCHNCGLTRAVELLHARGAWSDALFCNDCLEEESSCCSCGGSSFYVGGEWNEDDGDWYCEDCARPYGNDDEPDIHYYSYKPRAHFHEADSEPSSRSADLVPFYFGIELETECRESSRETAELWKGFDPDEEDFYLKEDSSLYNGIEVVSHPRTLDSWHEYCASEFASILAAMARNGARSWTADNCGLHVHVSNSAFDSPSHLARFALLINRNRMDSQRFANRESSYANFDQMGATMRKVSDPGGEARHMDAVNLYGNDGETVEVRIFKPSLAVARVLASIEFVAAGVEYTRTMTSADIMKGSLRFTRFARFMSDNGYECATMANEGQRFTVASTLEESLNARVRANREGVSVCA